jgi:sugar phosphate isomerase/epimerase
MRISISNIAWDPSEDEEMVELLHRYDVDAIDVAPGKYFPKPAEARAGDIARVRHWWEEKGISIVGMQSLLFGTSGFNVFSPSRESMLAYLTGVCRVAGGLGSTRLVFGSPRNRDRSGCSDTETEEIACAFFGRLGDIAQREGVQICLEPNSETAKMVRLIDHPSVGMQFDTGALCLNKEDPMKVLSDCSDVIRHIHASEPNLVPLGDGGTDHASMARAAQRYIPDHIVTIEMRATQEEPHLKSIERALQVAKQHYGVM